MDADIATRDPGTPIRDADVLIEEDRLHEKEIRCQLSPFKGTEGMGDYEYNDLGTPEEDKTFLKKHLDKKRFRLLELQPGLLSNPQVICKIFEVELDITDGTVVRVLDESPQDVGKEILANTALRNNNIAKSQETDTKATSAAILADKVTSNRDLKSRKEQIDALRSEDKKRSSQRKREKVVYEALSWRWGNERNGEHTIMVEKGKQHYRKRVSRTLGLALKYLRFRAHPRVIWIDALCIDQSNHEERSIQVAMMDRLYTGASQVAVWLGEDEEGDESRTAINFIKNDVSVLKEFDKLCRDKKYTDQWKALLVLMQREWFSRRWVVQEVALARKATVYYGPDQISWRQLATAIGLFVEVESATHRLSELMKSDERFNLIPNWFEHIAGLPASLLVNESSKIFRDYKREEAQDSHSQTTRDNSQDDAGSSSEANSWMLEDWSDEDRGDDQVQVSPSDSTGSDGHNAARTSAESEDGQSDDDYHSHYPVTDKMQRSLLTLEYLVTSLAIFDCGPPHDFLYALIAISRDAFPSPPTALTERTKEVLLTEVMEKFVERKPFPLDYNMAYPDVCKCFVDFCIRRRAKSDATTALDILCRPWSKDWKPEDDKAYFRPRESPKPVRILEHEGIWRIFSEEEREKYEKRLLQTGKSGRPEVDPYLVYNYVPNNETYSRSDVSKDDFKTWKQKVLAKGDEAIPRDMIHRKWAPWLPHGKLESGVSPKEFWEQWMIGKIRPLQHQHKPGKNGTVAEPRANNQATLGLPSWVARISNARFDIFRHPGMDMVKMGRKNADPLVGNLENNAGIYRAAQSTKVDFDSLCFKKREIQPNGVGHYSLYVKGFIIDRVAHVSHVSSAGVIPEPWLRLAKWDKAVNPHQFGVDDPGEPPDNFWRTLVADRGTHSNPPYYYARACRETVMRGGLRSGAVDTMALKSYERNSIIAEFCRRVQSVIWNRAMITTASGKLGLVSNGVKEGDLICILNGCSVPVILRYESRKAPKERLAEQVQDSLEAMRSALQTCIKKRALRARYRKRKREDKEHENFIQDALKAFRDRERENDKKNLDRRQDTRKVIRRKTTMAVRPLWSDADKISSEPSPIGTGNAYDAGEEASTTTPNTAKPKSRSGRSSRFNQIKSIESLKMEELRECWPAETRTEGKDVQPEDDNLSEDDFKDKDKAAENKRRWGSIWKERVTREKAANREERDEVEKDGRNDQELPEKDEKRCPWRQEMAMRRDPWRRYTFQGEAYVHGFMDGEAVSDKFYRQIPDHLFEIR